MSTTNPNITTDGALVSETMWVRYPCASCDEEIKAPEWPETTTPRCYVCTVSMQKRADVQTLQHALSDDSPDDLDPTATATARLILHLLSLAESTARDVAKLQNTWAANLTDAS